MVRRALFVALALSLVALACTSDEERAAEARAVAEAEATEELAAGVAAQEDATAALAHFERALELDPSLREAAERSSQLYQDAGRHAEAKAVAERAILLEDGAAMQIVLAHAEVALGNHGAAATALEQALDLEPARRLWPEVGRLREQTNESALAIAAYRTATEVAADDWQSWERLGTLSLEAGDAEGGKSALMQARNQAPWESDERAALNARLAELEGVTVEVMQQVDEAVYRIRHPHISQVTGIRPAALRPEGVPDRSTAMVAEAP